MSLLHKKLTKSSVKEAFDNLPSGVCFFASTGILVLCNLQMHRLSFALTGRDLQTVSKLRDALAELPEGSTATRDKDTFLLPDQSAWSFAEQEICDRDGNRYTQLLAANVTDLYRAAAELDQKNGELSEIAANMERINKNIVAIMREEEILNMKMLIHSEMGSSVLNTRQFLLRGYDNSQKAELVRHWRRTLEQLAGAAERDGDTNVYKELQATAEAVGAKILLTGALPEEPYAAYVLVAAMRECLTNTIRHAGGSELYVTITAGDTTATAVIINNGSAPAKPIAEGGGLGALRTRIEKAGGVMTVQSQPSFALTVTVPLKGSETL